MRAERRPRLETGCWKGRRVFLVGGGPSLRGFDWSRLEGRTVVAVNASAPELRATARFVVDHQALELVGSLDDPVIWQRVEELDTPACVTQIVRSSGPRWGRSLEDPWEGGVVHASNAGVTALNFVDVLGAELVCLLGFDLLTLGGRTTRNHDLYPDAWQQPDDCYERFRADFTRYAPDVRARVLNLGPLSALCCFPKATLEEVLAA